MMAAVISLTEVLPLLPVMATTGPRCNSLRAAGYLPERAGGVLDHPLGQLDMLISLGYHDTGGLGGHIG
jgi:hypothetical protein